MGISFREYNSDTDSFTSGAMNWNLLPPTFSSTVIPNPTAQDVQNLVAQHQEELRAYAQQRDEEFDRILQGIQEVFDRIGGQLVILKEQKDFFKARYDELAGATGNNGNTKENSDEIDNWTDIQQIFGVSPNASK